MSTSKTDEVPSFDMYFRGDFGVEKYNYLVRQLKELRELKKMREEIPNTYGNRKGD